MGRTSRDLYTAETERGKGRRRRGRVAGYTATSWEIQQGRSVRWVKAPSRFTSCSAEPGRHRWVSSIQPPLAVISKAQSSRGAGSPLEASSKGKEAAGGSGVWGTKRSPHCPPLGLWAEPSALPALLPPLLQRPGAAVTGA